MGYYTTYQLSLVNPPKDANIDRLKQELTEISGYGPDLFNYDSVKWYKWEDDTKAFSTKYSELVFRLDGEGEESGDIWTAYFHNGKCVVHSMPTWVAPPFREEDLI